MTPDAAENPYRLPRTVLPRRYALSLEPDLAAASFAGTVDVEVEVREATDAVVLNAIELEVHEATVAQAGGARTATPELDEATERLTLRLSEPLDPGPATVRLRFTGLLNDKLRGFYRSTFTGPDGTEHVIATTQFEATDARRAFPCWDEPDLKAVFAVSLVVPDGLVAVSNSAIAAEEVLPDGRRHVRFADTVAMSTYLVAFVVGPFEVAGPVDVDGTPLQVVHPPGKGHLTPFGLEVGEFALRYLADYFALPYVGDSLDLIAVPDFAFGAMENLGAVTFRETLLLADPEASTQTELQNVVDVISHELAHMWFGDLVTMRWWNGLWLNEAFATFMEMKVTDAFRPEWQRWTGFGLSRAMAFDTDALASTRPIEYPVISPADAEGMFDVLTYEKGAAVVRMLEQYLGEERFREGIRRYMAEHQYANTETTDLWDAIEAATGEPVRRIMDSWILQGGHPIVSVRTGAEGRVLHLAQEPFRYSPGVEGGPGGDGTPARWAVPVVLRYATVGGEVHTATALLDGADLEIDLPEPVAWVVANVEADGFYRVRYSPELRDALAALGPDELSALERHALVDDLVAAVLAGQSSAAELLALLASFGGETDLAVWRRLVGALDLLDRISGAATASHAAELIGPALARMGWAPTQGESERDRELRGVLAGAMATLGGDADAALHLRDVFADVRAGRPVDANLASAAIRTVASLASADDLDELIAGFKEATSPQEEMRYLNAMADVRDPNLFGRVLELMVSDDVRTQNAPFVLSACIANRENGRAAWDLVTSRWDELNERFPSNTIVRMLSGIRTVTERAWAEQVVAFVEAHPVPQGAQQLAQHLERMWVTVGLAEREGAGLRA